MANGKIRDKNHIIDEKAVQFLKNKLPIEWVWRQMTPDYGIDFDLELFESENNTCVTLGEHVFLQVKGTEHAIYKTIKPINDTHDKNLKQPRITVLKFSIDVALLKLVERMGSGLPVLLVVVDLIDQQAYQICLNDYIRYVLPEHRPNFRDQTEVTINIPIINTIDKSIIMWYGKRSKIYSLFQEINAVSDDCIYANSFQLISKINSLINRIKLHDAWSARKFYGYMDSVYILLNEMIDNNLITEHSKQSLRLATEKDDNWENDMVFIGLDESPVRAYEHAQAVSCEYFLEQANGMAGYFDSVIRHCGLPTMTNHLYL